MIRSIQAMAQALGILMVAEGMGAEAMRDLMRGAGVDWGQGHLWESLRLTCRA
ncbi:MAG: EAL domain-containing protein [Betaproteobacteria bacterium]|nr:EAL domain-containing protein [Betaproteobacteria bacterium]